MRTVNDWVEFKSSETVPVSEDGLRSDHHVAVKVAPIIRHLQNTGALGGEVDLMHKTLDHIAIMCYQRLGTEPDRKSLASRAESGVLGLLRLIGEFRDDRDGALREIKAYQVELAQLRDEQRRMLNPRSAEDEETIKRLAALCLEVLAEKQFAGTAQPGAEVMYLNVVVHRLIAAYEKLARPPARADKTILGTIKLRTGALVEVRFDRGTWCLQSRPAAPPPPFTKDDKVRPEWGWRSIDDQRWYPEEARALREMEARVPK